MIFWAGKFVDLPKHALNGLELLAISRKNACVWFLIVSKEHRKIDTCQCFSSFLEKGFFIRCASFGFTYTKIGTIQRRLAWPLRKDDTQIREAFHIFHKSPWALNQIKAFQCMKLTTGHFRVSLFMRDYDKHPLPIGTTIFYTCSPNSPWALKWIISKTNCCIGSTIMYV